MDVIRAFLHINLYLCEKKLKLKVHMIKFILKIMISVAFLFGTPTLMETYASIEIIDVETPQPVITISESVLHVSGANGQMLHVYNVAGVRVLSIKIEGLDRRIDLGCLNKGCYIIKVGKTVRKISIR